MHGTLSYFQSNGIEHTLTYLIGEPPKIFQKALGNKIKAVGHITPNGWIPFALIDDRGNRYRL